MRKFRLLAFFLAITLLIPNMMGVSKVFAANLSFTIGEVITDETVTILVKDVPKNLEFIVRIGEYHTKAINGIEAGRFNSGDGGALQATITIPEAFKGRAQLSIRIDSVTGGWFYYNWFWNKTEGGTWPNPPTNITQPPAITPVATVTNIPLIFIESVESEQTVTVSGVNFPNNAEMQVLMGKMFTRGENGIVTSLFNTKDDGTFEATFDIPAELCNDERVAIRVESIIGRWYAYNWFWNKEDSNAATSVTTAPEPGKVTHPLIYIAAVEAGKTVTLNAENLPASTDFTVLIGKMGTKGINGIAVASFNSATNTSAEFTVDIPEELANEVLLAIRIESINRGFAYNWFWNR